MKKLILILFILVLFSQNILASTITLDKSNYNPGETVTAEMTITIGNEKNQAYTVVWINSTGQEIAGANDTGTTPSSNTFPLNEFFEDLILTSDYISVYGSNITAKLVGTTLEGSASGVVSAATSLDLLIQNISVSTNNFIGKSLEVSALVKNGTEVGVNGAICQIDVEASNGLPIAVSEQVISGSGGHIVVDFDILENRYEPGTQYIAKIGCFCNAGTNFKCSSGDDGASSETVKSFLIDDLGDFMINKKWRNSTGFFDDFTSSQGLYPAVYLKNEFGGKTLIEDGPTNINQSTIDWSKYNNTLKFNSTQNGEGFVTSTKKASLCFLVNNSFTEEKFIFVDGVSFDDDTLQQHFFPESPDTGEALTIDSIILRTSVKPSSTDGIIEVCSEEFLMPGHAIGGNDLDINFHLNLEEFEQEIELESDEFSFFSRKIGQSFLPLVDITNITTTASGGSATSCTDINITSTYDYYSNTRIQYELSYCFEVDSSNVFSNCISRVINPDVGTGNTFFSTMKVPYVDFGGSGKVEVTVNSIEDEVGVVGYADSGTDNAFTFVANYSDSCKYSHTLGLQAQQRQAAALEGISTKTGTFHLDVNCPSTTILDQTMNCDIVAQIEDIQIVQKEVDFTCYISDGVSTYSSVNFNQMVTRNPVTINRDFHVPSSLSSGSFVLQCHADYYNLGKRRDSFYDTFLTYTSGGGSSITGGVISEGEPLDEEEMEEDGEGKGIFGDIISKIGKIFKIPEITGNKPLNLIIVGSLLLLLIGGIVLGIIFFMGKRKKLLHHNPHDKFILNKTLKKVIVITIALASMVALILLVYYGAIFLVESLSNINLQGSKTILDNSFSKLILLIGFLALITIVLFKSLKIQGEIRFGDNYSSRRFYEDRKSSKMQKKLNRMVLRNEIKNIKKKK